MAGDAGAGLVGATVRPGGDRPAPGEAAPVVVRPGRRPDAARILVRVAVVLLAVAGVLLRLWVLGRQPVSSDEAVVGLMAREILHGHFFAFYWGQRYGGGEPYAVAIVFAVLGQSPFTLAVTPVVLDAVAAVLVWRIGAQLFGPRIGAASALLFWVWPEVYVWQSTAEYGFRLLTLDCGLALMLLSLRLSDGRPGSRRARIARWALLGAFTGLGWWCSPEIAYYALPSFVLLAWRILRRRAQVRAVEAAAALGAAVLGALPWLWGNVADGFASLRPEPGPDPGLGARLGIFAVHVLPLVLGLRLRDSGWWLVSSGAGGSAAADLGRVLYALVAGVVVVWLVRLALARRALVLVGFALVFPLIYAKFPATWFWQDGRYAIYLAPVAALLLVSAAGTGFASLAIGRRSRRARDGATQWRAGSMLPIAGVLAGGLALTLTAATQLPPYRPVVSPGRTSWLGWRSDPNGAIVTLAHGLEAARVRDAYAGYWVAYVLDLEGRGRLVVSDARPLYVRYEPYLRAIEASRDPAWLFENPSLKGQARAATGTAVLDPGCAAKGEACLLPGELESWMRRHRIAYRALDVGDFVAVLPRGRVPARDVLEAYGIGA